jgi:DoxX-like protein
MTNSASRVAATVTTGVFAALMTLSGILYLVGPEAIMAGLRALGYPVYFLKFLGAAKILGAAALFAPGSPRLREWAYAGFTFDLIAAVVSHVLTGTASHAPPPLAVLTLLMASYLLRRRATAERTPLQHMSKGE